MVTVERFELPTHGLEIRCSILLSYTVINWYILGDSNSEPID